MENILLARDLHQNLAEQIYRRLEKKSQQAFLNMRAISGENIFHLQMRIKFLAIHFRQRAGSRKGKLNIARKGNSIRTTGHNNYEYRKSDPGFFPFL